MTPVSIGKGPCFGGLFSPKNRGHLQVPGRFFNMRKRSFPTIFTPRKTPGSPSTNGLVTLGMVAPSLSELQAKLRTGGEGSGTVRFRENPVREVVQKGAVFKTLGWLFDIGDDILPKYMGIIS